MYRFYRGEKLRLEQDREKGWCFQVRYWCGLCVKIGIVRGSIVVLLYIDIR